MWRSGSDRYGLVAIGFHWTIALGITGLVGLGAWMVGLTYYGPWYNDSLALHKAIGIVILALALAKFGWRLVDRKPGYGPEVGPHERAAASAMHWVLNGLMVLLPVSGYLISTSEGAGIGMFGLFDVPAFFDVSVTTRDLAIDIHYYLAYGGIALVGLHALAALKHTLIDRGSTLFRMLDPRPRPDAADGSVEQGGGRGSG